ncbi:hypothetical protein AC480_04210 [miscellaneous Crenarchaeota group archaeon SMTZ1-55]|nr:MAG: hypothetical protein AC480_04210 [miscellaneous Crenarchaeota group archaeon SMTZ1-55]
MTSSEEYKANSDELERRLRLKSFPLAVKLLASEDDVPPTAYRPLRDSGYHLDLCQAFQIARREGTTVAMLKEDMWCFEPVVGYGLEAPPEYFLEGHNRYPRDVETLEAGRHYAEEFPRFAVGEYVGVVSAPLKSANFTPDLVMIYCDSEQLNLLLLAREYKEGYNLKCALSSHAACVYAVVPAIQTGTCQVAIPCRGDRWVAMAESDELIFTVPLNQLEDVITGLRHVETTGSKLPHGRTMHPESELSEEYKKIAHMMKYLQGGQ